MRTKLSIIIPIYNEAGSIQNLIERIDRTLKEHDIKFEIIIIDDHSDDKTPPIIRYLMEKYEIRYFLKEGKKGKAQSIIQGFSYVKESDYIVIIDGDLQYSPETIPEMIRSLDNGLDVVIARRQYKDRDTVRQISGSIFSFISGRLLHGFTYDIQSGLKAFKTTIVDKINFQPRSGWMFDLEFLLQARTTGAKIGEVLMPFQKRNEGKSKVNLFSTSIEMAIESIRLKFHDSGLLPFTNKIQQQKGAGFYYRGKEYINYTDLPLKTSAFKRFIPTQLIVIGLISLLIIISLYLNRHMTIVSMVSIITALYFLDLLFLFYLVYSALTYDPSIDISDKQLGNIKDENLPIYTILCPLYNEAKVLKQFTSAISAIDYPKDKLQVLILLEEDDIESKKEIDQLSLPSYFEVLTVPESSPKTKPKALNYGLQYAKGEFLVIYDAEDIPDIDQLKKVWVAYSKADPGIACIQAKLHYYNTDQNILTRLFSIEYLLMFDLILPGLQSIHAPIPLGGTSNHFRTKILRDLRGWDAFNVTEDADLGIRLYKAGYRTEIIDSITYEEANSKIGNWIKQRTRWIKGYMQTYFVHIRDKKLTFSFSNPHTFTFHLIMGWKSIFLLINPFLWILTISYFIFRPQLGSIIESFFPPFIFYVGGIVLITGNFLYSYMYLIAIGKRSQWNLAIYVFLVPLYWLLMSYAAFEALIEFTVKPHHWNKTIHGLYSGQIVTTMEPKSINIGSLIPPLRQGAFYEQKS